MFYKIFMNYISKKRQNTLFYFILFQSINILYISISNYL